jgi:TRAP transporter TAXI family solute receptor
LGLKLKARLLIAVAAVALLTSCGLGLVTIVFPVPVTIATANPASIYYPVGNAICRIVNLTDTDDPAKRCRAITSEGARANVEKVHRRKVTFGLTQSDLAYGAYRGEGSLVGAGSDLELRTVVALQRESFTVIARAESNIRDFQDLRDKRIGIGKSGAGFTFTRDVVLGFYGWTISAFDRTVELGPTEQNRTLCAGDVDAIIFEAVHPNGLTQEATDECHARLVRLAGPPIDRLLAAHPYYVASTIPGGMYHGNPDDTPTISTQTLLITSARQSDDLVYAVTKAVFENFSDLQRLHPALSMLRKEDMVPSETVMPIHPGALRYYREAGFVR